MTSDDHLSYLRMHARALIYEITRKTGPETNERDIETIAAMRLVQGELLRIAWPAHLQEEARAIGQEVDGAVNEAMVARQWNGVDGITPDFLVLSWLMRRGPRRVYSYGGRLRYDR